MKNKIYFLNNWIDKLNETTGFYWVNDFGVLFV